MGLGHCCWQEKARQHEGREATHEGDIPLSEWHDSRPASTRLGPGDHPRSEPGGRERPSRVAARDPTARNVVKYLEGCRLPHPTAPNARRSGELLTGICRCVRAGNNDQDDDDDEDADVAATILSDGDNDDDGNDFLRSNGGATASGGMAPAGGGGKALAASRGKATEAAAAEARVGVCAPKTPTFGAVARTRAGSTRCCSATSPTTRECPGWPSFHAGSSVPRRGTGGSAPG